MVVLDHLFVHLCLLFNALLRHGVVPSDKLRLSLGALSTTMSPHSPAPVSYTHLTLPTIYSV